MGKTKNEKGNHAFDYMPLDKKSNEDFNEQHPDHDENGLLNANAIGNDKEAENDNKQTPDMKPTEIENKEATKTYTCSMHPEVVSDKPGKCPKCGMELVEK